MNCCVFGVSKMDILFMLEILRVITLPSALCKRLNIYWYGKVVLFYKTRKNEVHRKNSIMFSEDHKLRKLETLKKKQINPFGLLTLMAFFFILESDKYTP